MADQDNVVGLDDDRALPCRVQQFMLRPIGTDNVDEIEIVFAHLPEQAFMDLIRKLKKLPGVVQVETPDRTLNGTQNLYKSPSGNLPMKSRGF